MAILQNWNAQTGSFPHTHGMLWFSHHLWQHRHLAQCGLHSMIQLSTTSLFARFITQEPCDFYAYLVCPERSHRLNRILVKLVTQGHALTITHQALLHTLCLNVCSWMQLQGLSRGAPHKASLYLRAFHPGTIHGTGKVFANHAQPEGAPGCSALCLVFTLCDGTR